MAESGNTDHRLEPVLTDHEFEVAFPGDCRYKDSEWNKNE